METEGFRLGRGTEKVGMLLCAMMAVGGRGGTVAGQLHGFLLLRRRRAEGGGAEGTYVLVKSSAGGLGAWKTTQVATIRKMRRWRRIAPTR